MAVVFGDGCSPPEDIIVCLDHSSCQKDVQSWQIDLIRAVSSRANCGLCLFLARPTWQIACFRELPPRLKPGAYNFDGNSMNRGFASPTTTDIASIVSNGYPSRYKSLRFQRNILRRVHIAVVV